MASTNVNVRLSGKLMEHLEKQISDDGLFENASEYVRDLIRHDLQEQEKAWGWLRSHLEPAILADDSEYIKATPAEIIRDAKARYHEEQS